MPWLARHDPVINWENRTLRVHRKVHPIIPLTQLQTLLPPVPKHKSQRLSESLNVSRIGIRLDLICDESPPQGFETTMARQLRELTHRIRKVFQLTVSVTIVHQFRELIIKYARDSSYKL
ncbi:hypothetical protein PC117_g5631 [Phytophthora cactorum]|uniref:Uncharacterized protein n=1 Tax=Phytophthora cactorum TaxID=29920 RepID=A0A8T1E3T7_9STRA|nr:hypothetical protein PC117_g5631 [Phytophthora cactorum]